MIVAAWFTMVGIVIIVGFVLVGLTLRHWSQQKKLAKKEAEAASSKSLS